MTFIKQQVLNTLSGNQEFWVFAAISTIFIFILIQILLGIKALIKKIFKKRVHRKIKLVRIQPSCHINNKDSKPEVSSDPLDPLPLAPVDTPLKDEDCVKLPLPLKEKDFDKLVVCDGKEGKGMSSMAMTLPQEFYDKMNKEVKK